MIVSLRQVNPQSEDEKELSQVDEIIISSENTEGPSQNPEGGLHTENSVPVIDVNINGVSSALRIESEASHDDGDEWNTIKIEEKHRSVLSDNSDEKNDYSDGKHGNSGTQSDLAIYREIKKKGSHSFETECFKDPGDGSLMKRLKENSNFNHPIVSRRVFQRGTHTKTTLKFRSLSLVNALKESIFPSRGDAYARLHSPKESLHKPYVLLFQNRQRLQEAAHQPDTQKAAMLRLLLDYLREDMPRTWQKLDELETGECTHISFEDVWLLYPPGTTIYCKRSGIWQAYKVEEVIAKHLPRLNSLQIRCQYLDFDETGSALKPSLENLSMLPFAGERLISDLEIIPKSHHTHADKIFRDLLVRGKSFWAFRGQSAYREYSGAAWPTTLRTDNVRVVVDYVTSSKRVDYTGSMPSNHCNCSVCSKKYAGLESYPEENSRNICPNDRWANIPVKQMFDQENMAQDLLTFCPAKVWAFSLKHKSWQSVEIERLRDVVHMKDPFKKLVLNEEHKRVVESMVDASIERSGFSDIVKDKGRGLVILLHGEPGTGKTLTAECVAETKKRPLYMVTCGDLGTDPDELESRLQKTFRCAVDWKAILLLDEADVFLQERSLHDLKRNALVSIFLRHIEYYDGLLFLTTNRPGQMDEAFQSRIHITLGLPALDFEGQKQVWRIFINKLKLSENKDMQDDLRRSLLKFVRDELEDKLKSIGYKMNGRQIRNCIRAATAIASKEERSLQQQDIIDVIELGKEFRNYMIEVNRMDNDQKAQALGVRMGISVPS
ncbi:P-loop containing nucleoside triphosphate hydrolase protein [Xylaria cubensis]|nr:P-loop containing nucleoside triphosphate hydrolase protein [Xylaria cubensis]